MRQPQARISRSRKSSMKHVTAPVGGLNVRDSIADMPPEDAVILTNMFCLPNKVVLRKGHTSWATGMATQVEGIFDYNAYAVRKLFAATATAIYDITATGAATITTITGCTSGKWQHANFATLGSQYLYLVNGVDPPALYNGTAWQLVTGLSVPIMISGVATTSLIHVNEHGKRLFFVEANTLTVWYLGAGAIGGAATAFNFTSLCVRGGHLIAMYSWTMDAGYGMDDHAVFVTSEGEVLVYRGIDPSAAATWVLVGIYTIGRPLGRRCGLQFGSDLLIIGERGLVQLSAALLSSKLSNKSDISDKIQTAITAAVTVYGGVFGWQCTLLANENLLLLNVPSSATASTQYVMNTQTGAWAYWTGINGNAWCEQAGTLYVGGLGIVYKAWNGTSDALAGSSTGQNINGEALQAFSYLGTSDLKALQLARPVIAIDNPAIGILVGINLDFDQSPPSGLVSFPPSTAGIWDASLWDQATWAGDPALSQNWQSVGGVGYAAAMHIKVATKSAQFAWFATDYVFSRGVGI